MKKGVKWLTVLSFILFVLTWSVMGLKLLEHDYDITAEAYLGLVFLLSFFVCLLYSKLTNRCPRCGKPKQSFGRYCPHCGREIS